MEIRITGDPVIDNLKNRKEMTTSKLQELAYKRLLLMRQVEEIDKLVLQFEGASLANDAVQKDIDLRKSIAQAQKEAAEKKAAEASKLTEEAK